MYLCQSLHKQTRQGFFFSPSEPLSATTSKNHSGLNTLDSFNCQSSCHENKNNKKTTTLLWQDLCAHIKSCINMTGTELQAWHCVFYLFCKILKKGNINCINKFKKQVTFCQDMFVLKIIQNRNLREKNDPTFPFGLHSLVLLTGPGWVQELLQLISL